MGETRKRAAILSAATRLFAGKGFANTTTSEIAREAGVAEGTLYHHFGGKDDIFLTIFSGTIGGYLSGMEAVAAGQGSGRDLLRFAVRFHFDYIDRHAVPFLVILRDIPAHMDQKDAGGVAARRRQFGRLTSALAGILSRGTEDGSLRLRHSSRDTALMLRGILYGTTRHRMLGVIDVPLHRLAKMVEDFCIDAMEPASKCVQARIGGIPG